MQPDVERLLRESRSALPEPDPAARRRGIGVVLARIDPGRGRRRVSLFSAAIVALLAASLAVAAERIVRDADRAETVTASRIIDRTFVCRLAYGSLDIVVSPRGAPDGVGGRFTSSGYARLTAGSHGDPLSDLVVAARPGFRSPNVRFLGAVYARSRRCVASRATVPLALAGLAGPPTEFLTQGECFIDGRVLVRVRGVLSAPATWRRLNGAFVGVGGRLLEAEVAVRDERGRRPLAFVRIGRSGRTQLWTAQRCA